MLNQYLGARTILFGLGFIQAPHQEKVLFVIMLCLQQDISHKSYSQRLTRSPSTSACAAERSSEKTTSSASGKTARMRAIASRVILSCAGPQVTCLRLVKFGRSM